MDNYKKNNKYQSVEGIIKLIIDKVITISIRKSNSNHVDKQIKTFSFNYLIKQINLLAEQKFIYDYSDNSFLIPNSNNDKNTVPLLYWNLNNTKKNSWTEIEEPSNLGYDRNESSNVTYKELKIKEEIENNQNSNKTNQNITNNIMKRFTAINKEKNKNSNNNMVPTISDKSEDSESENKENSTFKKKTTQKTKRNTIIKSKIKNNNNPNSPNNNFINNRFSEDQTNKKKKTIALNDLPSYDIPNILQEFSHEHFDPKNIEFLRIERQSIEEKALKLKKQQLLENDQTTPRNENNVNNSPQNKKSPFKLIKKGKKLLDPLKVTFDPNGKIMGLKFMKIEDFNKDFLFAKNSIKINRDKNGIKKMFKKKNNLKNKKEQEKDLVNINQEEQEIIKNVDNDYIWAVKNREKIYNDKGTIKIIPSGSNFDMIQPNTGVTIIEKDKTKEGSRDFNKHFNKYSAKDYDRILNEYLPLQNRTILKEKISGDSSILNNSPKNALNNSQINDFSFNSSNLLSQRNNNKNNSNLDFIEPLIINNNKFINNNEDSINLNLHKSSSQSSFMKSMLSMNGMTSRIFPSYYKKYNSRNLNDSISIKKSGVNSIKLELETLKDLNVNFSPSLSPDNLRIGFNYFGKDFLTKYKKLNSGIKKISMNENNKFNKEILNNSLWGNDIKSNSTQKVYKNSVYARHANKNQRLRELGSEILGGIKVRLPRERKVDINI